MAADPETVTMNVSLPEPLKRYVDGKVTSGFYGSASEFVGEAIREKLQREQEKEGAKASLAAKLVAALDSGEPILFTEDHFRRKKAAISERIGKKKGA